jgi:hypothetical protein
VNTRGPTPAALAGPEFFAALGGRRGIGAIVDGLYDRLERDASSRACSATAGPASGNA